ncbi:MAG: hypothetical protein GY820_45275 [Gammaproteobacteria bacterium]|nr:hypothetical protein [Gammaproteobacteria bacterium]
MLFTSSVDQCQIFFHTPAADGAYRYTPNIGFEGLETFSYTLTDTQGNTDTATVTITLGSA